MGNILKVMMTKAATYQTNNFYAVLKRQEMLDKEVYDIVHRNKKMAASDVRKNQEKTVQPVKTKKKLSRADKKQIEAAIARANRTDKKENLRRTVSLMNGCGRTESAAYRTATTQRPSSFRTSTISSPKTKIRRAIFEGWCDFHNYFDSSIHFQLSFLNLAASEETFANSISIPPQRDAFDSLRGIHHNAAKSAGQR